MKHIVIQIEDVDKALTQRQKSKLDSLLEQIKQYRRLNGKPPENTYIILDTSEKYAGDVYRAIHQRGGTPCAECEEQDTRGVDIRYCAFTACPWLCMAKHVFKPRGGN